MVFAHGGLVVGGSVLLALGALWLVDPVRSPGLAVAPLAVVGTVLALALAVGGMTAVALRVRRQPRATGPETLIGQYAEVREAVSPEGLVFINGALWQAWTDQGSFERGEFVEIAAVENLRLYVVPVPPAARAAPVS